MQTPNFRYSFFIIMAMFLPSSAWAGTTFYICAHPDDCLLFMNPNLHYDTAQDVDKTVIIYLTSGDAGEVFCKDSASYPYVREQASIGVTQWAKGTNYALAAAPQQTEKVEIQGHTIDHARQANVVSYFLRLPDGNMDGGGFEGYGYQSLRKLETGEISRLTTIDGQNAYTGWQDLLETLSAILSREAQGEENITVHLPDTDTTANPGDHSDHQFGARAIMEILERRIAGEQAKQPCYQLYKHLDYVIATLPANLDPTAHQDKVASFAALTGIQQMLLGTHHWDQAHTRYLARNYYTVESRPEGCGE